MTKLEKTNTNDSALAHVSEPTLSPLVEAAMKGDLDTDKLEKLLQIQKDYEANEAKKAFSNAMAECQKEMPMIMRNADNLQTQSKYAKHEMICKQIKPVYTKHGFSLSFHEGKSEAEGWMRIVCDVDHAMGHSKQYFIDLPMDDKGIKGTVNKTGIHAKGSTFSYGRRYLTLMIFDLATYDDNDGNVAPPVERLSEEQIENITALITEVGAEKHRFYKHFKITNLADVPAVNYKVLVNALEAKRKAK